MESERQPWLPALEPPAGGPERFRQRLRQAGPSPGSRSWRLAAAGAAAALAIAVAVLIAVPDNEPAEGEAARQIYQAESFDRLLGRPMARTETSVTIDDQSVRVSRVDNSNPKVRIYRVN